MILSRMCPGVLLAFFVVTATLPAAPPDEVLDSPMYRSPDIPVPEVEKNFPVGAMELWLQALQRPEADYQVKAADSFALAHRRGIPGTEIAIPILLGLLDSKDTPHPVQLAVVRALITLEARPSAPQLFQRLEAGHLELAQEIEPALARWKYQPAQQLWLSRLNKPESSIASLMLAVNGLAVSGAANATPPMRTLVLARERPGALRLAAARALGSLQPTNLETDAQRLATGDPLERLLAVHLLRSHQGATAQNLLLQLAREADSTVSRVALARLLELDARLLTTSDHVDRWLTHADAEVRLLTLRAIDQVPAERQVPRLANALADVHPDVRTQARRYLLEQARKPERRSAVVTEATRVLAGKDWRGQEQAIFVLALLDHKPAADRLLALLPSSQPQVVVASGWGLRKLNVAKTVPAVLRYVEQNAERVMRPSTPESRQRMPQVYLDFQLAQLIQLLAAQRVAKAEPVLREFIPLSNAEVCEARAAAIWTLGLLYEGKTDLELEGAFVGRLNATSTIPPEFPQVRWASAISLGRMKSTGAEPSLRRFGILMRPTRDLVGNACGWAIEQITGEKMGPPAPTRISQSDWFLVPSP